jgi:hypothetical protein
MGRFRRLGLPLAAILGAALFAIALDAGDHPIWPGLVAGPVLGGLAFAVVSGIAAGAAARAGEGSAAVISAAIAAFAIVLAVLSLVVPPVSIAALAAIALLFVARRRRADRKYAGLRILR